MSRAAFPKRRGPLAELVYALRLVGLGNAWRALRYSLRQSRRGSASSRLPQPRLPQGPPHKVEPTPHGARVSFATATLHITFLTPAGVRLTWQPGPPVPPWGRPPWPEEPPPVQWEPGPAPTLGRVYTTDLEIRITPRGLMWSTPRPSTPFRHDPWPRITPNGWVHTIPLPKEAAVLGLGLRAAGGNLRPGTYRLWNRDPGGTYGPGDDPLYLSIPLVWVAQPAHMPYLWFYENPADGYVHLDENLTFAFTGGPAQAVLFVGPPTTLAHHWAQYSGFPPLPPRWALGFHQSRWGYRTQAQVETVLEGYRQHALPLDALHLDIDHMERRRVFTVDHRRFPDLPGLARKAAAQGVHLVAIVDPGVPVDPGHPLYRDGQAGGHFCTDPQGREVHAPVWPGWCAFPDFTRAATRAWWAQAYTALWSWGAAGVWHDMNEPATFAAWGDPTLPPETQHHGDGVSGPHRLYHNLYGLHMNAAGSMAKQQAHPQRRPWLLSRSGWAGVQRHAWNWSADLESTWEGLRLVIPQALHLALSGQPYYGPDIGGFSGAPDAELFVRWFQLAVWLPFVRVHSSIASPPREPWRFGPQALAAVRALLHQRRSWLPYWYTLAWQASQHGQPLVRPLGWLTPQKPTAWIRDDAFLVGDAVLVAPVLQPGVNQRALALPAGRWYDPVTGQAWDGPRTVTLPGPWERTPHLLRGGFGVPLETNDGQALTWLLAAPPPGGTLTATAYLDAGDGFGPHLRLTWHGRRQDRRLILHWQATGAFPFPYRAHRLRVLGGGEPRILDLPLPQPGETRSVEVLCP